MFLFVYRPIKHKQWHLSYKLGLLGTVGLKGTMVRTYKTPIGKKPNQKHDEEKIKRAVQAIKDGLSIRQAEEEYGIPKSILGRRSKGQGAKPKGHPCVLSKELESTLEKALLTCADWGYPLSVFEVRHFLKKYLDHRGEQSAIPENLPGVEWANGFLKRHPNLLQRNAQNIKRSRAKVDVATMTQYFDNLETTLEGVPPSNIFNYDETNLTDDPGKKRSITRRGVHYPERVINSSKSGISLMFGCFADGSSVPIYVVYKAKHMWSTWVEGGPEGAQYNRTASGWFDAATFHDWFIKIALPELKKRDGRKVMIGDNLASHLSVDIVEKCEQNNIAFSFLPSNTTGLTQVQISMINHISFHFT